MSNSDRLAIVDVAIRRMRPTDEDWKYLVVTNRKHPGKFTMPGGKIEPGEGPMFAAARELREETGLNVDPEAMYYVGSFDFRWRGADMCCYSFIADHSLIRDQEPRAVEEGTDIMWVDRDDLLDVAGNCLSPAFYGWFMGKTGW